MTKKKKENNINMYNLVAYINQEMNDFSAIGNAMSLFYSNKKLTKEEEQKMANWFIQEKMKNMSKKEIERISKKPHYAVELYMQHLNNEKNKVEEMLDLMQNDKELKQKIKDIIDTTHPTESEGENG